MGKQGQRWGHAGSQQEVPSLSSPSSAEQQRVLQPRLNTQVTFSHWPQLPSLQPSSRQVWEASSLRAAFRPPRSLAGSRRVGQRVPSLSWKATCVDTEKSLVLGGGGETRPLLHAKGPLLVLIFLIGLN